MKGRLFSTALLAGLIALSIPALAVTTVDFTALGANTVNITTASNPAGCTLNGMTFSYDNFGSTMDDYGNPATAQVDSSGIFGSTYGSLIFDLAGPVTSLDVDFSLLFATAAPPPSSNIEDALVTLYYRSGNFTGFLTAPAAFTPYDPNDLTKGGDAVGTLAYSGAPIDRAFLDFSTDAPYFSVDRVSYGCGAIPAPTVPEPSSVLLGIIGFLGTPALRLIRRKR